MNKFHAASGLARLSDGNASFGPLQVEFQEAVEAQKKRQSRESQRATAQTSSHRLSVWDQNVAKPLF